MAYILNVGLKDWNWGVREMAKQLRTLAAFSEELGLIPYTRLAAHSTL